MPDDQDQAPLPKPLPRPKQTHRRRAGQEPSPSTPASALTKPLTPRQKLFCLEYIRHGDGKKAALAAGVAAASAGALANQWLDPDGVFAHVSAEVRRLLEEKRREAKVEAQDIVRELARVAFFNPKELLDDAGCLKRLREMPDAVACNIKKFKVSQRVGIGDDGEPTRVNITEIEFWNKLEALKQLAQHLGLLKDTTNITNVIPLPWDAIMGRRPPSLAEDPIEARLRAIEAVSSTPPPPVPPLTAGGDVLALPAEPDASSAEHTPRPPRGLPEY